jgi:hypothetical protein
LNYQYVPHSSIRVGDLTISDGGLFRLRRSLLTGCLSLP